MEYVYKTQGTCSTNIELNVEDGVVKEVAFWGGCNGNLQGISRLVKGMKVEEVIKKLEGWRTTAACTMGLMKHGVMRCAAWQHRQMCSRPM